MAAIKLNTVADYVAYARVLTQDTVNSPYRYPDDDFVSALNFAIMESRRIRPDMWIGITALPQFTTNDTTAVAIDQQYRIPFVYYMCGQAQLRDEEETQDTRAAAFLNMFTTALKSG